MARVELVPASIATFRRPGVAYRPLSGPTASLEITLAERKDDPTPLIDHFRQIASAVARGSAEARFRTPIPAPQAMTHTEREECEARDVPRRRAQPRWRSAFQEPRPATDARGSADAFGAPEAVESG